MFVGMQQVACEDSLLPWITKRIASQSRVAQPVPSRVSKSGKHVFQYFDFGFQG